MRSSAPVVGLGRTLCMLGVALVLSFSGCEALNPAFLNLIDASGSGQYATLDNAPGHVIVAFVNNVDVDERLLDFLESQGGVDLTPAEKRSLHPRIRMRVTMTFADGSVAELEFEDGNTELVEQRFAAQSASDLGRVDKTNAVGTCDVAAVQLQTVQTEVFVPVEITGYELIETTNDAGVVIGTDFQPRTRTVPQFQALQVDTVDENGFTTLRRNVDTRDVPTAVENPLCGSVVTITLDGSLAVPFLPEAGTEAPSFDQADDETVAGIGGRYRFSVTVN